jgi:beta-barrel assembly-enhancing protease
MLAFLAYVGLLSAGYQNPVGTTVQAPALSTGSAPGQTPQSPPLTPEEQKEEARHEADVKSDIEEGKKYAAEAEKQYKLSTNKEYQDRVARVGADIAAVASKTKIIALWGDKHFSKFDYTYKVIQGDDVNAFSLPGGHIYVFEGLMKQIESDDELAGVLGHETAHAALRHVATLEHNEERLDMVSLPALLAAILIGSRSTNSYNAGPNILLPGIQSGAQAIRSGWSVSAETAADYGGFQYLLKTKYDPSGMLTFMERLAEDERLGLAFDWGIYRDHPPGKERAEALVHYMSEAGLPLRRSKVTTSFRVSMKPADSGKVLLSFGQRPLVALGGSEALTRADKLVTELNAFFDATPELFEVQAGPSGTITWNGAPIIQLSQDDIAGTTLSVSALRDQTLQSVRMSLFNLGFHVWASHM